MNYPVLLYVSVINTEDPPASRWGVTVRGEMISEPKVGTNMSISACGNSADLIVREVIEDFDLNLLIVYTEDLPHYNVGSSGETSEEVANAISKSFIKRGWIESEDDGSPVVMVG